MIQSDGPVIFSCGRQRAEDEKNRPVADALVKFGDSAVPDLEEAFNSIEERGQESPFAYNSEWLLEAYVRIRRSAAYAPLQRMRRNPKLVFLQWALDHSTALSFGLTSYVSSSGMLVKSFSCNGIIAPRELLDQLVLAWERNDRRWVERSLAPSARAALSSLLDGRTWGRMRGELWPRQTGNEVAVGYRFDTPGWWSEPPQPIALDERGRLNPEIDTTFTNSVGRDCGKLLVKFLKTDEGSMPSYLIDNSDLKDLLQLIGSCADTSLPSGH